MNIRKTWFIGTLLILSLVAFVGCSNGGEELSDMEMFERAFTQSLERHSFEFSGEMGLSMRDLSSQNQALGSMMGMLDNIGMSFEGIIKGEDPMNPQMFMTGQVNVGGFGVAMEMYMLEDQIAIKAPMMAQVLSEPRLAQGYLLMDLEDDFYHQEGMEQINREDQEELLGMIRQLGEIYMEIMEEDFITNNGETTLTINQEKVDVQEFEIYMGKEEIRMVLESVPELVEDPNFRELVFNTARMGNIGVSSEEIEEEMDRFLEEFDQEKIDELIEGLDEVLDFDESYFSMILYFDEDYRVVREEYDMNFVARQNGEAFNTQIIGSMEYWNINGDLEIAAPEFTEENSVPLQDLLFLPGF